MRASRYEVFRGAASEAKTIFLSTLKLTFVNPLGATV
jgi:hypothetical protein